MTLSKLCEVLRSVAGGGHPAVFRTPDGKEWEAASIQHSRAIFEDSDTIKTTIILRAAAEIGRSTSPETTPTGDAA